MTKKSSTKQMDIRVLFCSFCLLLIANFSVAQAVQIALLKYNGGGDWYANPTSLKNLIKYANQNAGTNINVENATVDVGSADIFNYPFVHMTGHGNVVFSSQESSNLRNYLIGGGFLHIDDNYGLNQYVRREMKKVFATLFAEPIFLKFSRNDGRNDPVGPSQNRSGKGFPPGGEPAPCGALLPRV